MNVQLLLERPRNHFTNLDQVSGKVALRAHSAQNVENITVKLEGESRTRLMNQPGPNQHGEKRKTVLEVHKILYKVEIVWPSRDDSEVQRSRIIPAGLHEYPFSFKIPFNNACSAVNSLKTNTAFMGMGMEVAEQPKHHIKTTLPPTLYFPGEAEIRYYIKVTVRRPSLFKENPRCVVLFNFFPIEPPRQTQDGETFARRQHQFLDPVSMQALQPKEKRRGTFPKLFEKSPSTPTTPTSPSIASMSDSATSAPRIAVEARLPNPAIVTCNATLPLRIFIKKLSEGDQPVYMQTLQVELIGYTHVRAHDVFRRESSSWVIVSLANMSQLLKLPDADAAGGAELELDKGLWTGRPLPNTVAPTFTTCNLKREYELVVSVGLNYANGQFTVLPLRLPLKVYSGIPPPAALLEAMRLPPSKRGADLQGAADDLSEPVYDPTPTGPGQSYLGNAGAEPAAALQGTAGPSTAAPVVAPSPSQGPGQGPSVYDDAPPSYEDAIAGNLPPVDGPRPTYEPPTAPAGEEGLSDRTEKRRLAS